MEKHDNDPTRDQPRDPPNTFHDELGSLGERLRHTYRRAAAEGEPSEKEIKDAIGTLLGAWDRVSESVSMALRDPEVRRNLKAAAGSLAAAVGTTMSELATELTESERWRPTTPEDDTGEEE